MSVCSTALLTSLAMKLLLNSYLVLTLSPAHTANKLLYSKLNGIVYCLFLASLAAILCVQC